MFSLRRVYAWVIALTILATLPFASASFAQGPQGTISIAQENEALMKDAYAYATTMGVDLDEAVRRLHLQGEIGNLNATLVANEGDTFAGLWIQHQPAYRVIVQFTRDGEVTIRSYIAHGPLASVVEIHAARVTVNELESARAQAAQIAGTLNIPASSGINVLENRAELYVLDPV